MAFKDRKVQSPLLLLVPVLIVWTALHDQKATKDGVTLQSLQESSKSPEKKTQKLFLVHTGFRKKNKERKNWGGRGSTLIYNVLTEKNLKYFSFEALTMDIINTTFPTFQTLIMKSGRMTTSIPWKEKVLYGKCQEGFLLIKLTLNVAAHFLSDLPSSENGDR